MFESHACNEIDKNDKIIVCGQRHENRYIYIIDLSEMKAKCLIVTTEDSNLWHRRLIM